MQCETVGVVGAGVMGVGVAQNLAQTGHRVVLVDIGEAPLQAALAKIRQGLRMQTLLRKQPGGESSSAILQRITCTTDYSQLEAADFVIENVIEKRSVKAHVYKQLDTVCRPAVIFGVNTSAISITYIASLTQRPDRIVGMHFMNPVPLKSVVEVIRGYHTSETTLQAAQALLTAMGKSAIVVNDMPGFVSNRILMLTINEAIFVVQDRVASVEDVDRLFTTCFDHKMGPLQTADLIGLDTILLSLEVLYESYNDPKFRPCPLLKQMVHAGLYGCKSGQGFYSYEDADGLTLRNQSS